jgi:signal recognition particle protein
MFENLSERLDSAIKQLKGEGRINEINVASTIKDIRRALVDADVNYKIAKEFTDRVKDKATGEKVLTSVSPGQLMVKIVKDELADLMGGTESELNLDGKPTIILIAGLQGSGKTTFSGKLANFLRSKKKYNPLLVAGDVYRPAAVDQLKVLGEQVKVPVYSEPGNTDPVAIALNAIAEAKKNNHGVVIIDTAGRLAVDEAMMKEVANIKAAVNPQEILFVVDSMTGQDAVNTAKAFNDRLDFTGVVLTKLDGDTRGGAALSIKYTVDKPIKFVSMGEKLDTLDVFYPERMAQRILGMGDITTLVERAQAQYDEVQAKKLEKKIRANKFDFEDFKEQLGQIKKMGNIKDLLAMIPGIGKAIKDIDISDDAFKGIEAIINSMTPYERSNPDAIDGSRRKRIAAGSGKDIAEVNAFMKQFEQMRQMMGQMGKMRGMMPGMGMPGMGGGMPPFGRK